MIDLLPQIENGQIVEEKKDIYSPFWEHKKENVFHPTLFNKFANQSKKNKRGKGARITYA